MGKIKLILKKIIIETKDTKSLIFKLKDNQKIEFLAGQFLNLFFEGEHTGRSYTISSSSAKKEIQITVKKQKNFSVRLHEMKVGDEIIATGPFGFLTSENIPRSETKKPVIFIAGGIGITPFFSILSSNKGNPRKQNFLLFYANKNKEKTIFYEKLEKIKRENKKFIIKYYWSKENNRLSVEKIKQDLKENLKNNHSSKILKNYNFFICGSISFGKDFRKQLLENKVAEKNIFIESF